MTKINDIITDENGSVYTETTVWCNENAAMLEEIEPDSNIRRFKVLPVPEPNGEEKREKVRFNRDQYLRETDKYMLSDYPVSEEEREKYRAYRRYLRDYPETAEWFDKEPTTFEKWKEIA